MQSPVFSSQGLFRVYVGLFAMLPWSGEFAFSHWSIQFPSEPWMGICAGYLGGLLLFQPKDRRVLYSTSTVFWLSLSFVLWFWVATCFSSMPYVSIKYVLVETVHWCLFVPGIFLIRSWWPQLLRAFTLSMALVALYTLLHHAFYHFRADQALLAPMPFFPENTLYAAVLAMILPWLMGGVLPIYPWLRWSCVALLGVALVMAGSLGAVLSVLAIGALFGLMYLHASLPWFSKKARFLLVFLVCAIVLAGLPSMLQQMRKDVSTMERINRYHCAARMLNARPWMGFGPGTFADQYFPFQHPAEMTRISLKSPISSRNPDTFGRGGGAHSEFWQVLAETGWPGFLILCTLMLLLGGYSWPLLFKQPTRLFLCCLAGLGIFLLLGLTNNFMHDGRVAALAWGQIALLIGCFQKKETSTQFPERL